MGYYLEKLRKNDTNKLKWSPYSGH
jgi:hypothetical protein